MRRNQPARQSVAGVIGHCDGVVKIVIAPDAQQRAKDLFIRHVARAAHLYNARRQQRATRLNLLRLQQGFRAACDMVLPGLQHVQRGLFGNQPADKRLRIGIPRGWHQTRAHLNQTFEERIPLRAPFHQQTAGTGATLSGGNKGGLNRQVHRGVDIVRVFHNQRVVAPHLESKDFFRLPRQLAMQLIASPGAAGKQQAVDIAQRAQRLAGFASALHQVQHARRQASLFPQLNHRLAG